MVYFRSHLLVGLGRAGAHGFPPLKSGPAAERSGSGASLKVKLAVSGSPVYGAER